MHILIAPNAFKNSLNATAAATAIKEGLIQSKLNCSCECFPIADGGDGTAELIIKRLAGTVIPAQVQDPLGRNVTALFGLTDNGKTAVIEMADASGLRLLKPEELDPLHATSFGTGELIKHALDKDVSNILIAMGGSATVDGGVGILSALGVRFLDENGQVLKDMPETLTELSAIDISHIDERIYRCRVTVLCDVDNAFSGNDGAAAVFGPQKGATTERVKKLDSSLSKFAAITLQQTGKDMTAIQYGGTAGGAAAGLWAFLNAELVNGINHFLQVSGFDEALQKSDLVITGEGSIDEQTIKGKGPFGVAYRASKKGIPVIGVAGKLPLHQNAQLQQYFDVLLPIGHQPLDVPAALKLTAANLVRTSRQIGNLLALNLQA